MVKQTIAREKKPQIFGDTLKDKIFRDILTLFETKGEYEKRTKKKHNERIIRERIIRDVRTQQEEDYYEPKRPSNFWNNSFTNMKVMVIKAETYH